MTEINNTHRTFGQNARLIIIRSGAPLLVLSLAVTFIEQYLTGIIHDQLMSHEGAGPWLWISIVASVLVSVLYPLTATLLTFAAFRAEPILQTVRDSFEQLLIENLRALGKSMAWGLLLIIPGIVRFIQYSFVNFIIILDPRYAAGDFDVLTESMKLVNRRFWKILGLFLLASVIAPLLLSSFDDYSVLMQTPISAVLLVALEVFLFIVLNLLLFKQWESANGTHV